LAGEDEEIETRGNLEAMRELISDSLRPKRSFDVEYITKNAYLTQQDIKMNLQISYSSADYTPRKQYKKSQEWVYRTPEIIQNSKVLSKTAKRLYPEIVRLSLKEGYCFACNEYLGNKLNIKERQTRRLISELINLGLVEKTRVKGKRYLRVLDSENLKKVENSPATNYRNFGQKLPFFTSASLYKEEEEKDYYLPLTPSYETCEPPDDDFSVCLKKDSAVEKIRSEKPRKEKLDREALCSRFYPEFTPEQLRKYSKRELNTYSIEQIRKLEMEKPVKPKISNEQINSFTEKEWEEAYKTIYHLETQGYRVFHKKNYAIACILKARGSDPCSEKHRMQAQRYDNMYFTDPYGTKLQAFCCKKYFEVVVGPHSFTFAYNLDPEVWKQKTKNYFDQFDSEIKKSGDAYD
jgi:hypothetical protein